MQIPVMDLKDKRCSNNADGRKCDRRGSECLPLVFHFATITHKFVSQGVASPFASGIGGGAGMLYVFPHISPDLV
jgi:hypothetical protein